MVKSHRTKKNSSHASHSSKKKHVSKQKKFSKNQSFLLVGTIAVILALLILSIVSHGFSDWIPTKSPTADASYKESVDEPVNVELYVMSQCPYGVQAEQGLFPALDAIGLENVDLSLEFIVNDMGDGTFQSLHGEPEVQGNIVQLCALQQDQEAALDLISCMNQDMQNIPSNWESCAQQTSLDIQTLRSCYQGEQGKELLSDSAQKAVQRQASGSPTIYLNDQLYTGPRGEDDFLRAMCQSFESQQPQACADVPEPVAVELTVLNDQTCTSCDTTDMLRAFQGLFPGLVVDTVDVSSSQGKSLIETHDVEVVPAYFVSENVQETDAWSQEGLPQNFQQLDDQTYRLKNEIVGASYYVSEDKRQERLEQMGITLDDDVPQVDFFIMSYCPYGNIADELMGEVHDVLGDTVEFKPHYIYYENYQGGGSQFCMDENDVYCSMHGVTEARQNIREQCVLDLYGLDAWFDFTKEMNEQCSAENADTCFESVAQNLGYDVQAIQTCFEENKFVYAQEDVELMEVFGARGSPTIYIQGQQYQGERSSNAVLAALCEEFSDAPQQCDQVIQTDIDQNIPAGQC